MWEGGLLERSIGKGEGSRFRTAREGGLRVDTGPVDMSVISLK